MKTIVFACVLATASAGQLVVAQVAAEAGGKVVGPGVTWTQETAAGPLNFNVLRVQIDDPLVRIETESAHDKLFVGEKTHQSAQREEKGGQDRVVAAVNGDFFIVDSFFPIGLLVADGMIYDMPSKHRSAFVLTKDETPYIGPVTLDVSLQVKGDSLKIDRINSGTKSGDSVVLFTAPYGDEVGPAPGKRFRLKMEEAEFLPNQPVNVTVESIDSDTTTPLSHHDMILQIPPSQVSKIKFVDDGKSGVLSAKLPQVSGVVASVCGGGPAIVLNGKVDVRHAEEKMSKSSLLKHPRTAVGFTKDKNTIYLVTVDGRQPRLSVGVTLDELAKYMLQLGCWAALNLDGGGSTSMVVNGKVVNHPSDIWGPRSVANSLLVVAINADGSVTSTTTARRSPSPDAQPRPEKQY